MSLVDIANDKYIFISYSHKDSAVVKRIVSMIRQHGYACWNDENIVVASVWTDELAKKIKNCALFFAFYSENYGKSEFCKDEWAFAKKYNKSFVVIKLDDSKIPDGMDLQSLRFQHISYDETPSFYDRLFSVEKLTECCCSDVKSAGSGGKNVDYNHQIRGMINWLVSFPRRWGTYDCSTETQSANTCEGLLAMKISGFDVVKRETYRRSLETLIGDITGGGLKSKSLRHETVVCTAMVLFLAGQEKKSQSNIIRDYSIFDRIAQHLWEVRNPERGWGVYCERMSEENCSLANSCWAMLSLLYYPAVAKSEEFQRFCCQLFEFDEDGTFGFYVGGESRVATTAMYLCLYYLVEDHVREYLRYTFAYGDAIKFIYEGFVEKNQQIETEILYGIEKDVSGVKKAPWTHITVGAGLSALSLAYQFGDLSLVQWQDVLQRVDSILKEQLIHIDNKKICYRPRHMEPARKGNYTFPTAYLIWGLCMVEKVDALGSE